MAMQGWNSRRSTVYGMKGICASTQYLASAAGVKILEAGGNAADAGVAMAACLNMLEPCSTGIGGDAFVLYYDAKTKDVSCLMGNGASSRNFTMDAIKAKGTENFKPLSAMCVTVPGAAACWEDLINSKGTKPMSEVLSPAIELGEKGFPIGHVVSNQWAHSPIQGEEANRVFKPNGRSPKEGELFFNPDLARTFRELAEKGAKEGFYKGRIGEAIVEAMKEFGGFLDMDDLETHTTEVADPISISYRGYRIWETPPPTHGIAALQALKMLEKLCPEFTAPGDGVHATACHSSSVENVSEEEKARLAKLRGSIEQAHLGIECMRMAYADALHHVADPNHKDVDMPIEEMLSEAYAEARAALVGKTANEVEPGDPSPFAKGDTVYFCVVDAEGNACSMINSNYQEFGTGIMPRGCGFTLQNRGFNFSLEEGHPNQAAPRKRPYHTIIPGMITREGDGSLFAAFGNMGGYFQPMGHVQLVRNLIDFKMAPQAALDAPRWSLDGLGETKTPADLLKSRVKLEDGYGGRHDGGEYSDQGEFVREGLREKGHSIGDLVTGFDRTVYGKGQIIVRNGVTGMLSAGSEPRADGFAMPAHAAR